MVVAGFFNMIRAPFGKLLSGMTFWIDPLHGWRAAFWATLWWVFAASITYWLFPLTDHRFVYFMGAIAVISVRCGVIWGMLATLATVLFSLQFLHPHPRNLGFSMLATLLTSGVIITLANLFRKSLLELRQQSAERKQAQQEAIALLDSEKRLRAELETANHTKDEFLATLSHELRTPLTAIMGWGQILRMGKLSSEELLRAADVIDRNARMQVQLIDDLLDMSRITNGKIFLELREVDLNEVVTQALNAVLPAADAKGVHLYRTLEDEPCRVNGDSARLQQCVTNLLNNAVKFTPAGGRVDLTVEKRDGSIEVSVRDTGIGMNPEFVDKAFDRFRQSDSTTTRRHGGLGLGLAIVKSLVEMHGGSVRATSTGEGNGSMFALRVPALSISGPAAGTAKIPEGDPARPLTGVELLVVEDDPDSREWLVQVLRSAGVTVSSAPEAQTALRFLMNQRFSVVISDIAMPGMDGLELMRKVRGEMGLDQARLRAIALSAYGRAEDRQRAREAGFDEVLTKPVEITDLLAAIRGPA